MLHILCLSGGAFKYSVKRGVEMMSHETQCVSSWHGWTATLVKLSVAALDMVYWTPWIWLPCPQWVRVMKSARGKMEIMAVYCIPFIMSCLLAYCFIATLLHSRTILVCKLYVFTLICNRYDIKINEFMFLIHQQELSLVV